MVDERQARRASVEKENRDKAIAAAVAMYSQRAEDVVILDLRGLVEYTDFFVIGSASSVMRVRGVARAAERAMARAGGKRLNQPDRETGWSLLDYGDVIVHVFDIESRDFYRLEDLWGDAPRIERKRHVKETDMPVAEDEDDVDSEIFYAEED